jgi:predicted protein tyrosine phosphatase
MNVYVTNRNGARTLKPPQAFVWVSISTPGDPAAPVSEGSLGVLRLWFHDLETAPGEAFGKVYGPHRLFNDRMAVEVVRFIIASAGRGVQDICAHCDAGVSRSGAVAMWLHDTFGAQVFNDHPLDPNLRVRRLLDRAWQQHTLGG